MDETKPFWQSKTFVAGLVTIVFSALSAAGVGGLADQQETTTQLIFQLVTALAGILTIAARLTATKRLTR